MLVVMYSGFVGLGVVSAVAGIPSLDLTTPDGYVTPYALAIAVCAVVALVGSTAEARERTELTGALPLFCLLTAYAGAAGLRSLEGNLGTAAFSIVVLMITLVPAARGISLLRRRISAAVERRQTRAV